MLFITRRAALPSITLPKSSHYTDADEPYNRLLPTVYHRVMTGVTCEAMREGNSATFKPLEVTRTCTSNLY